MKHVGIILTHKTPTETIKAIVEADKKGVETVWAISGGLQPDLLTYYAAAAVQTENIRFGTSIIPMLPRHPITLASQVMAFSDLAPGRLRLGIGTSHKSSMEQMLGVNFEHPWDKLREYVKILRLALWEGKVDFSGDYYNVHDISLPSFIKPPKTPILISALREKAFELAGEISDGAISWMCPIDYLVATALPALQKGAKVKKRTTPPLVAHVPVAFSDDVTKVLEASHKQLGRYGKMPFYAKMFSDAGFSVGKNGELPDELIKDLVVYGNDLTIRERLQKIFQKGIDEILILPVIIDNQTEEEKALIELISS